MKRLLKIIATLLVIHSLTILTGCKTEPVTGSAHLAGRGGDFFHGGRPNFRPGPEGGVDQVEIRPGVDFAKYKMIILDPVIFQFDSVATRNAITRVELNGLRRDFHRAFADALGTAYPLVNLPNLDTMRVRVLVNGIAPSIRDGSPGRNVLSAGGASMRAEVLDSMTDERLAAAADLRSGNQLQAERSKGNWVGTDEAFRFWAKRLRLFLDHAHGRQ